MPGLSRVWHTPAFCRSVIHQAMARKSHVLHYFKEAKVENIHLGKCPCHHPDAQWCKTARPLAAPSTPTVSVTPKIHSGTVFHHNSLWDTYDRIGRWQCFNSKYMTALGTTCCWRISQTCAVKPNCNCTSDDLKRT